MTIVRRILDAFSAKETSIATGVILAAMAWALARLVDSVAAHDTLEYEITQRPDVLASGQKGFRVRVKISNLSGATTLESPLVQLSATGKGVKFSEDHDDYSCTIEPPGWVGSPQCDPIGQGFVFRPEHLVANTYAGFEAMYTRTGEGDELPTLRIQLPPEQNFRLEKAGLATAAVRHQAAILVGFVLLLLILLIPSVVAGVREPRATA